MSNTSTSTSTSNAEKPAEETLPPGYRVFRWSGRYWVSFTDSGKDWVLDGSGHYAGLVEHDKPAWPGVARMPRGYTHKRDAVRFANRIAHESAGKVIKA